MIMELFSINSNESMDELHCFHELAVKTKNIDLLSEVTYYD